MSETGAASATGLYSSPMRLWSSTTAIIATHTDTHLGNGNGNRHFAGANPSDLSLVKPPQPPNVHIGDIGPVLPPGKYRPPSSLFWSDGNVGTGVLTNGKQKYCEHADAVVNLTFDSVVSSPPPSPPPPPPPPPTASPLDLLDTGKPYVPDIPDAAEDRDLEYVTQLQVEEVQKIRDDPQEDEQMAKRLVMGVETATATPLYNLRPRPRWTGMSSAVPRPISWPPARPSRTKMKMKMALNLTLERECTGCYDPFEPLTGLHSSCGHHYCLPCVQNMVMASVSDESLFPPKCCNQPLMTAFAGKDDNNNNKNEDGDEGKEIKLLGLVLDDKALKEKMESRWQEWSVKGEERVYCSNSSCAVFLGSTTEFDAGGESSLGQQGGEESSSPSSIARCAACSTLTCVSCRQGAHAGQTCADSGEALFWDMVKVKRWRQCPTCSVVIEKDGGCNIMKCPCGNKFTYENV